MKAKLGKERGKKGGEMFFKYTKLQPSLVSLGRSQVGFKASEEGNSAFPQSNFFLHYLMVMAGEAEKCVHVSHLNVSCSSGIYILLSGIENN